VSARDESLEIRRYEAGDEPAVLELLQASLGWVPDEQYAAFFRWKHVENPFGASPAWVAVEPDGGRIVGFRVFLRWEFVAGGEVVRAVRAVDTATHPDHQGRGVFTRLTLHALAELREDGVAFVFNTPNDRSRPGYLRMGWELIGRLPVLARPRSLGSLARLVRARTPADKWSTPTAAGGPVPGVLDSAVPVDDGEGWTTNRTAGYLRWRYGFEPLGYRTLVAPGGPAEGVVVFRLRRRGPALEAAVCEELAPRGRVAELVRSVLRATGADHAVRLGGPGRVRRGFVPLPRQGPTLTWRAVATPSAAPDLSDWNLTLGDVELF
jgi:GNAT superfamily N-acetyltransferase